jgi:hypothetical protein
VIVLLQVADCQVLAESPKHQVRRGWRGKQDRPHALGDLPESH